MDRGTTPVHTFTLPFNADVFTELKITYAQNNQIKLIKRLEDCTVDGQSISYKLTQEETFLFDLAHKVQIQLRGLDVQGNVMSSRITDVLVGKCLDSEVLK